MEGILYRNGSQFPCLVSQWMYSGTARHYCMQKLNDNDFMKFVSRLSIPTIPHGWFSNRERSLVYPVVYLICTRKGQHTEIFVGCVDIVYEQRTQTNRKYRTIYLFLIPDKLWFAISDCLGSSHPDRPRQVQLDSVHSDIGRQNSSLSPGPNQINRRWQEMFGC